MFVEDVIVCALRAQSWWTVSEHLLSLDCAGMKPAELARQLADRHELRLSESKWEGRRIFRFERVE